MTNPFLANNAAPATAPQTQAAPPAQSSAPAGFATPATQAAKPAGDQTW